MSVREHQREQENTATSDSWLARFFLLIVSLLDLFANTSARQYREAAEARPDWRDHWPNLRRCEWHRDQIVAREAMQLLTGRPIPFELIIEPPADYGTCPKTPFAMSRRFYANARWMQDPEAFIRRHARRIARRAGIALSRDPLRLACKGTRSTSPTCVASGGGKSRDRQCLRRRSDCLHQPLCDWGRWRATSSSRDGGGLAFARARAPPARSPLPIAHCQLPQREARLRPPPHA